MLSHFSHVQLFVTPWTVACQASLSTGFSRREHWSELPYPPPRNLPNPGIKLMSLMSPVLICGFFTTNTTWEAPSSVQSLSCVWLCEPVDCSTPGFPVHHQLLEFTQTHVHWVGDAIQPSHPLSSTSPPAFNLSSIRVFSSESVLHIRWPKYWSFSFNISPSSEYSRLLSFRMDWLDLLAVQGALKSLLQHHSSKASILWCSAGFNR